MKNCENVPDGYDSLIILIVQTTLVVSMQCNFLLVKIFYHIQLQAANSVIGTVDRNTRLHTRSN